jgi:hypothetical protein
MCDVYLLRAAMIIYKSWTAKMGISADAVLTLPSLASTYAWLKGAHNGVCRYSGVLRAYLSNAVYGGRVMVRENQTTVVDGDIANVDAVSLYPSAMKELTSMPTGPGTPIIVKDDLARYAYYIVTIRITAIARRSPFPWICVTKDVDGLRNWTDDILEVRDKDIVMDSIMLRLVERKHGIDYDVICGWGWDNFVGNWPAVWVSKTGGRSGMMKEPLAGWSRAHEAVWKLYKTKCFGLQPTNKTLIYYRSKLLDTTNMELEYDDTWQKIDDTSTDEISSEYSIYHANYGTAATGLGLSSSNQSFVYNLEVLAISTNQATPFNFTTINDTSKFKVACIKNVRIYQDHILLPMFPAGTSLALI